MNIIKLTTIGLITLLASCNSTKEAANATTSTSETVNTMTQEEILAMDAKFENEGYTTGKVMLTNTACSVILEVKKTDVKFDPVNIDDEKFSMHKNQDAIVYFKYRPLRMMNRCDEAQPIELLDIKKREN